MAFFIITGKLGSGKSLIAVARIRDYLLRGCRVATNLDLHLEYLLPVTARAVDCLRVPDLPSVHDLEALGPGQEGQYDEAKFGALVIDEGSGNFNSREWANKDRQALIEWLKHSRKYGWDVYLIVQDVAMLDKQIRDAFGEHLVVCRRSDRLSFPLLTPLSKLLGGALRPPKIHVAIVRYGIRPSDPVVDRWFYRGVHLYRAYDTRQIFSRDGVRQGNSRYLSPYLFKGRYMTKFQLAKALSASFIVSAFVVGLVLSWAGSWWMYKGSQNRLLKDGLATLKTDETQTAPDIPAASAPVPTITGWTVGDGGKYLFLSDGSKKPVVGIMRNENGVILKDKEGVLYEFRQ